MRFRHMIAVRGGVQAGMGSWISGSEKEGMGLRSCEVFVEEMLEDWWGFREGGSLLYVCIGQAWSLCEMTQFG